MNLEKEKILSDRFGAFWMVLVPHREILEYMALYKEDNKPDWKEEGF